MPSFNVLNMTLVLLSMLGFLSLSYSEATPGYRYHDCSNTTTFTLSSTYQSNLNHLFLSLTSNATHDAGYYNTTAGDGSEDSNAAVYGAFLCRGDLTLDECQECVATAAREAVQQYCPLRKVAATPPPTPLLLSPPPPGLVTRPQVCCLFLRRRARKKYDALHQQNVGDEITSVESLQFDLGTIAAATKLFSNDNMLGAGGFGEVYKGTLPNGQEIVVKRLSRSSGQGAEEFKNEVVLVAKLHHKNLVRLLGFYSEGDEKILVYEYVENKCLDHFLYDSEKQVKLDWSSRYKIIGGVARGILYLHHDSRLKIIHRDLKASNVLLDGEMNPKIADFGMARIFGVDQTQGNTGRIVGTYGYMSPEYAMHEQFFVKSDVYSLGVLILEIVTGKKNTSFYQSDCGEDLMSYAWRHWRDGRPLELLDPSLRGCYSRNEVTRCNHIGLLCVQEDLDDRPTMQTIALMLSSFSVTMAFPQKPAFFLHSKTDQLRMPTITSESSDHQPTSHSLSYSVNEASITELYPR